MYDSRMNPPSRSKTTGTSFVFLLKVAQVGVSPLVSPKNCLLVSLPARNFPMFALDTVLFVADRTKRKAVRPSALLSVLTSSDVSVSLAAFLAALPLFLLPPSNVLHTCLSLSLREPFELRAPYCIAFKVYSRCEENISGFGGFLPSFNCCVQSFIINVLQYTHYGLKLDSFHACR